MRRMVWLAVVALGWVVRPLAAGEVTVDGGKRYQTIEGFGTCLVSWDPQMTAFYQTAGAQEAYAKELKLNILRVNLWGDGTIGPVQDPQKISCKDPGWAAKDTRTPIFVGFAKAIKKLNPEAKVIGTVWSPPAWMKETNAIADKASNAIPGSTYRTDKGEVTNRVKREYYPHFAKWLVEMVKYYKAQGVDLYAISPANEPQFTQTFESCVWTAKDLATICGMVGEALEKEKLDVKLFGPETMTGFNWKGGPNELYTKELKDNALAFKHLGFFATHGYEDGFKADLAKNSSAQFWAIISPMKKPYWVTEGATGEHAWPAPVGDKGVAAAIHNALTAGNASAFVPWQFAEGQASEHALMTTKGLTKKTYVVRQFSRYIPAGSVRVEAAPAYGEVNASAYVHDGSKTLTIVLINASAKEQKVAVSLRGTLPAVSKLEGIRTSAAEDGKVLAATAVKGGQASVVLPAQSIVTLTNVPQN